MADAHAISLQCFDHVCNLLFIICRCPEIFPHFLKKYGETILENMVNGLGRQILSDRTMETFLAVGEACIAIF